MVATIQDSTHGSESQPPGPRLDSESEHNLNARKAFKKPGESPVSGQAGAGKCYTSKQSSAWDCAKAAVMLREGSTTTNREPPGGIGGSKFTDLGDTEFPEGPAVAARDNESAAELKELAERLAERKAHVERERERTNELSLGLSNCLGEHNKTDGDGDARFFNAQLTELQKKGVSLTTEDIDTIKGLLSDNEWFPNNEHVRSREDVRSAMDAICKAKGAKLDDFMEAKESFPKVKDLQKLAEILGHLHLPKDQLPKLKQLMEFRDSSYGQQMKEFKNTYNHVKGMRNDLSFEINLLNQHPEKELRLVNWPLTHDLLSKFGNRQSPTFLSDVLNTMAAHTNADINACIELADRFPKASLAELMLVIRTYSEGTITKAEAILKKSSEEHCLPSICKNIVQNEAIEKVVGFNGFLSAVATWLGLTQFLTSIGVLSSTPETFQPFNQTELPINQAEFENKYGKGTYRIRMSGVLDMAVKNGLVEKSNLVYLYKRDNNVRTYLGTGKADACSFLEENPHIVEEFRRRAQPMI